MDLEDSSSSSSCSSSSSSSNRLSTSSPSRPPAPSPKRKAGRKKFRETRHPVYHGVRERNGGRWVCEVREPRKKSRIWLGTFQTPEMAATAHDVAAIALRGDSAHLNFPDSSWALPRPRSAAAEDIRRAAAKATEMFGPDSKPTSSRLPSSSTIPAPAPGPTAAGTSPQRDGREADDAAAEGDRRPPPVFVDEEALFNMPRLLDDMARGLLVTPPAMQIGFDWDGVDEGHMDLLLWTD